MFGMKVLLEFENKTSPNIVNFNFRNINKCKINVVAYSLLRFGNPNTSVLLKAIKAQQFKVSAACVYVTSRSI